MPTLPALMGIVTLQVIIEPLRAFIGRQRPPKLSGARNGVSIIAFVLGNSMFCPTSLISTTRNLEPREFEMKTDERHGSEGEM